MQSCNFNMIVVVYFVCSFVSFFTPCPSQTLAMALQLAGEFPARSLLNHQEATRRDAQEMCEVADPMNRSYGKTTVFLIGHPQRKLIEVESHVTISELKGILHCDGEPVLSTFSKPLRDGDLVGNLFPGRQGHILISSRGKGGAPGLGKKRAPWESTSTIGGLTLAHPDELTALTLGEVKCIPSSQINERSCGAVFVTMQTLKQMQGFRSANALLAITKGFVRPQVESLGFDEDRIIQTTLTIYDPILQSKESRAVTLTNLAMNPCDFFELTVADKIIEISETSRHAILAEIRKSDLDEHLWNSYGTIEAFESYIENCLRQVSQLDKCVQYRSSEKNGYLCKRIQVPDDSRDDLYKLSGKCGIQFRAIRVHDSPPESGLEVLRLPPTKLPMPKEVEKISRCPGYLGLFRTQNGTFVRVMDTNIADARLFLYGEADPRFTPFNRGIKCLLSYRIQGFRCGTLLKEIASFGESVNWPCVPAKTINFRDLCLVFVWAQTPPPAERFATSCGTILVTPSDPKPNAKSQVQQPQSENLGGVGHKTDSVKETARSSNKSSASADTAPSVRSFTSIVTNNVMHNRVDALEQKVQELTVGLSEVRQQQSDTEKQIVNLSEKQDQGFQQLLAAIAGLKQDSTPTRSPPHKAARNA